MARAPLLAAYECVLHTPAGAPPPPPAFAHHFRRGAPLPADGSLAATRVPRTLYTLTGGGADEPDAQASVGGGEAAAAVICLAQRRPRPAFLRGYLYERPSLPFVALSSAEDPLGDFGLPAGDLCRRRGVCFCFARDRSELDPDRTPWTTEWQMGNTKISTLW